MAGFLVSYAEPDFFQSEGGVMIEVSAPEWVENQGKLIEGLDILGLRLPVQTISGSLLNGVTTITPRVRHLSIRSWIIKAFSESGLPNDQATLSDFADRVEAALAVGVLLVEPSTLYIPGSTKAHRTIEQGIDPVPIEKLLDQTAFNAYGGPSYDLFLSYVNENGVPGITKERGEPLANEFDLLVRGTRFYQLLKENPSFDTVPIEILKELGSAVQIENIPDLERNILLEAIIPSKPHEKDLRPLRKEINRIATYTLLLELSNRMGRLPAEADGLTFEGQTVLRRSYEVLSSCGGEE